MSTRNWALILKPWTDARRIESKPMRDAVWREHEPLRKAMEQTALSNRGEHHD